MSTEKRLITIGNVVHLFTPQTGRTWLPKSAKAYPNRINEHRKALGMTQEELGDAIGITKQYVGMLEAGTRPLTIDRQRAIARVLKVDMADLLHPDDHPLQLDSGARHLLDNYFALPAAGRQALQQLSDNLREWGAPPPAASQGERDAG